MGDVLLAIVINGALLWGLGLFLRFLIVGESKRRPNVQQAERDIAALASLWFLAHMDDEQ